MTEHSELIPPHEYRLLHGQAIDEVLGVLKSGRLFTFEGHLASVYIPVRNLIRAEQITYFTSLLA
jgi:hypothetical protein